MVSYVFEGPKWRPGPITWSFADTTYATDQAKSPFSSPISSAAYQATVEQAIQKWATVSGLVFQRLPDTAIPSNAADIRIGFGKFGAVPLGSTGTVGQTNYSYYTLDQSFVSDIIIRVEDPSEALWIPTSGGLAYGGPGGSTFYQVILHELGHALGMGHSSSSTDIMSPAATQQNLDLSTSDIFGIRALYPQPSIQLRGVHTDYIIAQVSGGQAYIQDTKPGRDGVQTLAKLGQISFADGVGLFDPSGTAEDVARLYQGAFGRAPDLQGLDGNTALVSTNTISLAALATSFTSSPEFIARYGQTDTDGFARQLYLNVLHRNPDAAGQQLWVNYTNATSRGAALLAFSDSRENHQQTLPIAGSRADAEATRLYQAAFNRSPDAAGLALWSGQLSQGVLVDQVAQGFVESTEFAATYGALDANAFVTQLYANVLHRAPDAPGLQNWLGSLAGGSSRAHVMAGFADSNENRIATAGVTHDAWVYVG